MKNDCAYAIVDCFNTRLLMILLHDLSKPRYSYSSVLNHLPCRCIFFDFCCPHSLALFKGQTWLTHETQQHIAIRLANVRPIWIRLERHGNATASNAYVAITVHNGLVHLGNFATRYTCSSQAFLFLLGFVICYFNPLNSMKYAPENAVCQSRLLQIIALHY